MKFGTVRLTLSLSLVFLSCFMVDHVDSSKILVITFFSSKSHKITYLPLIEELGKRGHNITIVSPVKPIKEMKNVQEIFTMDVEHLFQNNDNFNAFEMKEKGTQFDPWKFLNLTGTTCKLSYKLPQVKALLREKFDLIFLQPFYNDCVLGLIYRMQAPYVLFTPIAVPSFMAHKLGHYFPSSFTPNLLGFLGEMTFLQRFLNFGVDQLVEVVTNFMYIPAAEKIYREELGQDIPSIDEILANASLVLSNSHFSVNGPKAYMPDIVDVGGLHCRPANPLPKELEDFIKKGKEGFIVFSMGTAIKGDMMPDNKRKMILKVFSQLKQQVFWKWESETMPDLPKNVMLSKWLPLQDLLGHKDIRLFITHCGGGSTDESIYHGVPLVGIPMMNDQPMNANLAKRLGFLVELSWNDMTEEDLMGAIQEVLNNPKYRDNVKKASILFKDRPQDPLTTGVYWVEYVLRHKGAPHLHSKAARRFNRFQYHSLDVIGAYLAIISTISYLIITLTIFIVKKLCCSSKKVQHQERNKKIN